MTSLIDWVLKVIDGASKKLGFLAPLVARLVVGVVFLLSGWGKLHNLEGVTSFFTDLHIPAPAFQAVFVSSTEFVGGILLLVGLLTRFASVALLITMIVAILTAQLDNVHGIGDFMGLIETTYAAIFIGLAVAGAGPVSVDYLLRRFWAGRTGRVAGGAAVRA